LKQYAIKKMSITFKFNYEISHWFHAKTLPEILKIGIHFEDKNWKNPLKDMLRQQVTDVWILT